MRNFIITVLGILIITMLAGFYIRSNTKKSSVSIKKACTQEAKVCPDGSAVGRSGPNCEFTACPTIAPNAPDISCTSDSDCYLAIPSSMAKCPQCGDCISYEASDQKVVSINKNWKPSCPSIQTDRMCPMCIGGISGGMPKCVNNKCEKILGS